jgi:hypothetical protein
VGLLDWVARFLRRDSPPASSGRRAVPGAGRPAARVAEPSPRPAATSSVESELDAALDDVFSDTRAPRPGLFIGGVSDGDDTRRLFVEIAAQHARPVKDFVFELREGSASRRWIEICRPVLASIADAAESMQLADLLQPLRELDRALASAANIRGAMVTPGNRDRILALYDKLAAVEPAAFAIDQVDRRRESIFLHSLLRQVPDVGYVTIEKLYRVGLTAIDSLAMASPQDLHATADIPLDLAQRICSWLAEHRAGSQGVDPEELARRQRRRVVELVGELRAHHEAFKRACDAANVDPSAGNDKREHRRRRHACSLQIEATLAELDELDLAREVQRLAFEQRIAKLEHVVCDWNEPDVAGAGMRTLLASKPTATES